MSRIVNSLSVHPGNIEPGDVMVCIVTLHVNASGFRIYRCPHPAREVDGVPQGSRILNEKAVAAALFPVVGWAGLKPDMY